VLPIPLIFILVIPFPNLNVLLIALIYQIRYKVHQFIELVFHYLFAIHLIYWRIIAIHQLYFLAFSAQIPDYK